MLVELMDGPMDGALVESDKNAGVIHVGFWNGRKYFDLEYRPHPLDKDIAIYSARTAVTDV